MCCIESSCLDNTDFQMLVDSGSSFSYLPEQIFDKVAAEVIVFLSFSFSFIHPISTVKVSEFVLTYCFGHSLIDK